jgi:exodeoxyribonuclease VII small subunit
MAEHDEQLTYKGALTELQSLVARIEGSDIDVDELATALSRGKQLVSACREKLRKATEDVDRALQANAETPTEG